MYWVDLLGHLATYWADAKAFLNSSFTTAFAGAAAGAWGAQHVAERAKLREDWINEIRNTNKASLVAFGICNALLSMKRQHIKPLKVNFDGQKAALERHREQQRLGQLPKDVAFELRMDLQTLSPQRLPIEILQRQLFEQLSLVGRPLNLATTLGQVLDGLEGSLEERNDLISSFKSNKIPHGKSVPLYLGEPIENNLDRSHPDLIEAIYSYTDDGIFFSHLLCEDLIEHGLQVREAFEKKFKKGAPKVNKVDFSGVENSGLMPNKENYRSWHNMFLKFEEPQTIFEKLRKRLPLNRWGNNREKTAIS